MSFPFPNGVYDRDSIVKTDGKKQMVAGHPDLVAWLESKGLDLVYRLDVRRTKVYAFCYERDSKGRNTGREMSEPVVVDK